MAAFDVGDTVKVDGEGIGIVKEKISKGFATSYDVMICRTQFVVELESSRLSIVAPPEVDRSSQQTDPGQSDETLGQSRFTHVSNEDIQPFIESLANKNTLSKTHYDLKLLYKFLELPFINEKRKINEIPPLDLALLVSRFFISVKKADGSDYEPNSLRGMMGSFDRQLRRHNYGHSIAISPVFAQVREVLKNKQKQLKQAGLGNLPRKSDPVEKDELDLLWSSGQFGLHSPDSILQTLWFYNTVHFGLRGSSEHHQMCWGDVALHSDTDGHEYLEMTERQTKTRTGINPRDVRVVTPKLWANLENPDRCPVKIYKKFADKRLSDFCQPDSPFYIASSTKHAPAPGDMWFKKQKVGVNKLGTFMKRMVKAAGIETDKKLTNHSARKYLVQKLNDSNVPANQIMQISGHKNISSINNYSHINHDQHKQISRLLHTENENSFIPSSSTANIGNILHPTNLNQQTSSSTVASTSSITSSNLHVFGGFQNIFGAPVSGGNFNIHIHQSNPQTPPRKHICRRIIESDSDSQSQ